ncbi:MAG: McrC family protein [Acidimicrobiales bacterium]
MLGARAGLRRRHAQGSPEGGDVGPCGPGECRNLFHLLTFGDDALDLGTDTFEYGADDLLPAFAAFYARLLERALARGVVRRYVETEDHLVALRGRVDHAAQRQLAGLPLPVACRFDDHTADIALNRIVHSAAERLARLPGVYLGTRLALGALLGRLEDVGPLRPLDLAEPLSFSRLDSHYEPVARAARLVLEGSSITHTHGSADASVFLIDVNLLFERFVEARLRRPLAGTLDVTGQETRYLDAAGRVAIRPDVDFRSAGRVVYVADAKYKVTASGYGRDADYYQLLAYTAALDVPEGVLVYCRHDGATPTDIEVAHVQKRLRVWPVSLSGTPAAIDAELDRLAADIAARVRAHPEAA